MNRSIDPAPHDAILGKIDEAIRCPGGTFVVRGWAVGPRPIRCIAVLVDGEVVGEAVLGRVRLDVAADPNLAHAGDRSGFELELRAPTVQTWREGEPVRVQVMLSDGRLGELSPVALATPVVGRVDEVQWSPLPSRPLTIRGWACPAGGLVAEVEVSLGGVALGRAGTGRLRPDVAADLGEPDAELSGFELSIETAGLDLPVGPTDVRVTARTLGGAETELPPAPTHVPAATPAPSVDARRERVEPSVRRPARRVLWFARHLDSGGSQLRMLELIARLRQQHGTTSVVVAPGDGGLAARLEAVGADVEVVPPVPLDDLCAYQRRVRELTTWAAGRFDAVVAFTLTSFAGIEVADDLGLPSIWRVGEAKSLHDVARWFGQELDPRVEARARAAAARAGEIVHVSEAVARTFAAAGFHGRSRVLRTGIDLAAVDRYRSSHDRAAVRRRLGLGHELVIVNAASLWPIKAQAPFLAAFSPLVAQGGVRCVLVGDGLPEYRDAVRSFVRRHGLEAAVDIRPFTDDINAWWMAADVALCSSETEAMPTMALEAMAFGLPVLASDAGGLPEVVREGVNGWLYTASDLRSASAAIARALASSPEERGRLGAAGRAHVARHHDSEVQADRFAELLGFSDVHGPRTVA